MRRPPSYTRELLPNPYPTGQCPGGSGCSLTEQERQNWPWSAVAVAVSRAKRCQGPWFGPPAPTGPHSSLPVGDCPHCCLQADNRRILLLAEQALRVGLEAALARRSTFDLVLSWADSVPFMHTTLGGPRLCPF